MLTIIVGQFLEQWCWWDHLLAFQCRRSQSSWPGATGVSPLTTPHLWPCHSSVTRERCRSRMLLRPDVDLCSVPRSPLMELRLFPCCEAERSSLLGPDEQQSSVDAAQSSPCQQRRGSTYTPYVTSRLAGRDLSWRGGSLLNPDFPRGFHRVN